MMNSLLRKTAVGVSAALIAIAFGAVSACGSCGASERRADKPESDAVESDAGYEAWGARFELPAGWSGGQNESGGFEFTDGDLALLLGHHALEEGRSLDDFFEERRRALGTEVGELADAKQSERRVKGGRAIELRGRAVVEGGSLEVRLMAAALGPKAGLSLMMVGDSEKASRLDPAWNRVVESLALP